MENSIAGFVFCEHEGTIHEDTEDPYGYGPQFPGQGEGANWVQRTDHEGYKGTLMFYVCPGPHRRLVALAEEEVKA